MANVSITDRPAGSAARRWPGLGAFDGVRDFMELAGAAIRVAGAVEDHRRPSDDDLAILGIKRSALGRFG
jgi:hypothetical protein